MLNQQAISDIDEDDPLVPTRVIKAEFDVCDMTIWRWERQGLLPEPTRINRRKYYPRSAVRRLKRLGRDVREAQA